MLGNSYDDNNSEKAGSEASAESESPLRTEAHTGEHTAACPPIADRSQENFALSIYHFILEDTSTHTKKFERARSAAVPTTL